MFIILRCGLMWRTLQGSCNVRMFWWEWGTWPFCAYLFYSILVDFFRRQQWLETFSSLGKFFVLSCFGFPVARARKEGYWNTAMSDVFSALKYKVSQSELLRGAGDTFNSIESCAVRVCSPQNKGTMASPEQKDSTFAAQLLAWPLEDHLHIPQAPFQQFWEF